MIGSTLLWLRAGLQLNHNNNATRKEIVMRMPRQEKSVNRQMSATVRDATTISPNKGIRPSDCCGDGKCCVGACLPFVGCAGLCVPNIGQC